MHPLDCQIVSDVSHRFRDSPSYKTWTHPDGDVWARFFRGDDGRYRILFPGLADFVCDLSAATVICHPAAGIDDGTVQHLFLNQVQPLMRSMEGLLVLHVSAIDASGRTVLFLGLSGRGKSTLATSFATAGHALISDDGVVFAETEGDLTVEPGHRSVRLWSDSLDAVLGAPTGTPARVPYSDKTRIFEPEGIAFCAEPGPVAAVFHLAPPAEARAIERLDPRTALAESLPHLFLLDDRDPKILAAHFERLAALCNQVPQYRLHYPRRFDILDALRTDILMRLDAGEDS